MKKVKKLLFFAAVVAFILYKAGFTAQDGQGGTESQTSNFYPSGSETLLPEPSGISDEGQ